MVGMCLHTVIHLHILTSIRLHISFRLTLEIFANGRVAQKHGKTKINGKNGQKNSGRLHLK